MALNRKRRTHTKAITTGSIVPKKLPPLGDDQVRVLPNIPEMVVRYQKVQQQLKLEQIHFKRDYKMARRAVMTVEFELFEALQYARESVIKKYGPDSPELHSLEAKYEHEFRKPKQLRSAPRGKKEKDWQH